MRNLHRIIIVVASVVLIFGFLSLTLARASSPSAGEDKPTPPPDETVDKIEQAIIAGMSQRAAYQPVFAITQNQVSNVRVSASEDWASAWLTALDPQTGESIPTEPGLVILQNQNGTWTPAFPGDELWWNWLSTAPDQTIPAQEREYWLSINQKYEAAIQSTPLTGYLLPWPNGLTRKLSGSVVHDSYVTSGNAHYAFDFYLPQQMWNVHASKAGTVWKWKDIYEDNRHYDNDGNQIEGNYIVIKDSSSTYQLYLHLAQNSIPAALKVVGAAVQQGQFIGIADNTGASTGHHLHFMVHTNPYSYWGKSVDIVFGDVAINGGRPRIHRTDLKGYDDLPYCWSSDVCYQFQESYVSGNIFYMDTTPPTGGLAAPSFGANITTNPVTIRGWAADSGVGVQSAQLRAYLNGTWQNIGPAQTSSPFNYPWDLCASNVPDGPVSLSLSVLDKANNSRTYASLVTFVKNYNCPLPTPPPPAACTPGPNQVALFSGDNYRGNCTLLGVENYSSAIGFSTVGDNQTASIKVGANVLATVFSEVNYLGRAETFDRDDSSLIDNRVGVNTVSSVKVQLKTLIPNPPQPVWPAAGGTFTETMSLSLYWRDTGGGSQFQVRLANSASETITSTWQTDPFWHLGTGLEGYILLPDGYTWQVRAKNTAGTSSWSPPQDLTIIAKPIEPATSVKVPFIDNMETIGDWLASGLWHLEAGKPASSGTHTWWFGTCITSNGGCEEHYYNGKTGDLTSPPIQLPASGSYYLRFKYRYQTESPGRYWDQRWVQVKVDNAPFKNLYQLGDDGMLYAGSFFLSSPVIDLSAYAGHIVQIRFHFDTMDVSAKTVGGDNDHEGWYIDDFSVNFDPPATCSAADVGGNTSLQSFGLSFNTPVGDAICPAGDLDYFSFAGTAGSWVTANTEHDSSSTVDTVLQLLAEDGSSILAENDDERYPEILDSFIRFYIPSSGSYFLKVKDWGHPGDGGSNLSYTVGIYQDAVDPLAHIVFPTSTTLISTTITLKAQVSDALSGVDRVEFYFHDSNWDDPDWKMLGYGSLQQGYWTLPFDPATEAVQLNAAFLILAYDRAGNVYVDALWRARLANRIFFTNLPAIMNTNP